MRSRILSGLVVLAVFIGTVPAQGATNLLANSYFNSSLNYWTVTSTSYVNTTWSGTNDAHSSSSSGSARLSDVDAQSRPTSYWKGLKQCTPVTSGTSYQLTAWVGIPSGQSRTGRTAVVVVYYSGSNCGGSQVGDSIWAGATTADGYWHSVSSSSTAPAGAASASIDLDIQKDQAGGTFVAYYDEVLFYSTGSAGTCTSDATHLCLTGNRFRVSMQWTNYNNGITKTANAVPFANETGFFHFGNAGNLELMVKVHDACAGYGHFWVFAAATTNVGYTLTVTDSQTSVTQQYTNPAYLLSPAITDQTTFGSCP